MISVLSHDDNYLQLGSEPKGTSTAKISENRYSFEKEEVQRINRLTDAREIQEGPSSDQHSDTTSPEDCPNPTEGRETSDSNERRNPGIPQESQERSLTNKVSGTHLFLQILSLPNSGTK